MSFPPMPSSTIVGRARSMSSPSQPSFTGPKWISTVLPTPPDSDAGDDGEAIPPKRRRQFSAFDMGFIPLTGSSETETSRLERCYEELEDEPELPPTPRIKLKDGRELRPLLKHRKRSASHHVPNSARWNTVPSPPPSNTSLDSPKDEADQEQHPHVHFSDALENVCVFDEAAPAHDSDPTHSPLEPPRQRTPPPASPRIKTRQLRLPCTVIASPTHKAALGFDSSSEPMTPQSTSPPGSGRPMHLKLACDSSLPSSESAPNHGMLVTAGVRLSPEGESLSGTVRVRNIAFEKDVCIIYTVDDWNTRHEVVARWTDQVSQDLPPRPGGYDDFQFKIPLADLGIQSSVGTAVRAKILRFAVRYQVPGQGEWWDNKDGANWVARFRAVSDQS